ncbi:hypothetical protein F5Y11DRAFT_205478 [Daldinia sp. FL1419]|nr:hypothetical protein F5Y11DRAFT_205478 [Daldinia sp. FL1419]
MAELQYHNESTHFFCKKCKTGFFTAQARRQHLASSNNHHFCEECSREFLNPGELMKHYLTPATWASGITHYYCQPCYSNFSSQEDLRNHYLSSKAHRYCYQCDSHFPTTAILFQHLAQIHNVRNCCQQCGALFLNKIALDMHFQNKHSYCEICDRHFETFRDLCSHKQQEKPNHACSGRGGEYTDDKTLALHQRTKHPYCNVCAEVFYSLDDLHEHNRLNHTRQRCRICLKYSLNAKFLNEHMRMVHYWCWRCGMVFATISSFTTHKAESDRHHVCRLCLIDYESEKDLNTHLCSKGFFITARYGNAKGETNEGKTSVHKRPIELPIHNTPKIEKVKDETVNERLKSEGPKVEEPDDEQSAISESKKQQLESEDEIDDGSQSSKDSSMGGRTVCPDCLKMLPSTLAMINHCEEGDCWEELYRILRREDRSRWFTTNSTQNTSSRLAERFRCPQPSCDEVFVKFSGLIHHLGVAECGVWLEEQGGDGLDCLKRYLPEC